MTIDLDDDLTLRVEAEARKRGQSSEVFAVDFLRRNLTPAPAEAIQYSVMEFAGVGANRPGSIGGDINSYITSVRDEWDEREKEWRP